MLLMKTRSVGVLSILALCSVCVSMLMLVGCGPSDEQRVTDIVTQELDAVKSCDGQLVDSLLPEDARAVLTNVGIDSGQFIQSALQGFEYSIGDVSVDKDTATVNVSVTCKTIGGVAATLRDDAKQDAEGNWGGAYLSDDEATQQVADDLMSALDRAQPVVHDNVSILFSKSDKTWSIDPSSQATLASLFLN